MIKRLIEAATALAEEATSSVEYSDWPELQDAIREVDAAIIEIEVAPKDTASPYEHMLRAIAKLEGCYSPRIAYHAKDDVIALTWESRYINIIVAVSRDGGATAVRTRLPNEAVRPDNQHFNIADGLPEDTQDAIRLNFQINQTVQ